MTSNLRARSRLHIVVSAVLAAVIGLLALSPPVAAQSTDDIAAEIEQSGRYLEFDDADVEAAVDEANDNGIAFVWLDQAGGSGSAETLAGSILTELVAAGSRYRTVLVLMDDNFGAQSDGVGSGAMNDALDSALSSFSAGAVANGVQVFTGSIASELSPTPSTTSDSGDSGSGGGIGLSTILISLLVLGGGFWLVRNWSRKRKADHELEANLAADRDEIREQLRDNADHVINLGDRVVASGDDELITTYEKASRAYQQVSEEIETADGVEEVDRLDNLIDQAEWEFEMIEAKLEGRPVPPSPAEKDAAEREAAEAEAARKRAEADKPALGPDESVVSSGRTRYRQPPPDTYYARRRGGFGGMGGGLGGLMGSIILGGMRSPQTRRTRRRTGGIGGGFGAGSAGGGVLRRGGSSGRSGGGRSLGSRRSGGGRSL